jgi:hypothetical protein
VTHYDDAYIDRVARAQQAAAARLLAIPGVRLVGLGSKETGGVPTGELAIRVHVERKRPAAGLPAAELIPTQIDGIPVDVIDPATEAPGGLAQGGLVPAQEAVIPGAIMDFPPPREPDLLEETKRPLIGGVKLLPDSIGRGGRPFGGTLGCLLRDANNPQRGYALTCQHVMTGRDKTLPADPHKTQVGSPDTQKGSTTCKTDNIIGAFLGGEETDQDSDEAVIELRAGMKWKPHVLEFGRIPVHDPITHADLVNLSTNRTQVRKRGVRTGKTGGVITDVVTVGTFDHLRILPNDNTATAHNKRICFADEGDSGAVVLDPAGRVLALVTGRFRTRQENGTLSVFVGEVEFAPARALPISRVLTRLQAALAAESPPVNVTLAVAMSNSDDEVFTVPGGPTSLAVPPEMAAAVAAEGDLFMGARQPDGTLLAPVGRPWFAADPAAVDRLALLRGALRATAAGGRLDALWDKHQRELRDLVDHDRRVTLAWHRGGGGALFQLLIRALHRPDLALPESVNGVPVAVCVDRLVTTFADRGSPALAADLRGIRAVLPDLGGRTLPEILAALGAVPSGGDPAPSTVELVERPAPSTVEASHA